MQLHVAVYLEFKLDGLDDLEWFEFVGYVKKLDDQPKTPGYKKTSFVYSYRGLFMFSCNPCFKFKDQIESELSGRQLMIQLL